jgi:putative membrane protein
MMWANGSWGFFPWMWIFPLLFLIVCVLFLARMGGWPWGERKPPESAREILDRRYARGEISREVYEQMKKDLQ